MAVVTQTDFRDLLIRELEGLDEDVVEVLDFVRFLKQRLSHLTPEERFDYLWLVARRVALGRGIKDADIVAEVAAVRREDRRLPSPCPRVSL